MYCKYCGKKIPDGSAVCPWCGKSLKSRPAPAAGPARTAWPTRPTRTGVPFFLLMVVLFGPTLWDLARHLVYIRIYMLVEMLVAVAAALLLCLGVKLAKIDVTSYRYSDAAVLACLWLLVPWISGTVEAYFAGWISDYAIIAAKLSRPVMGVLRLEPVWAALGILLLGLGRKRTWRPRVRHLLIAAGAMLLCSLLGTIFVVPISWIYGSWTPELDEYLRMICGIWCLLGWLWTAAVLLTFWRLGSGRIGPVSAGLAFFAMAPVEFLLLPVFVFMLNFGPLGLGIAAGLPPL